ncbi:MAG: DUF3955 domain-containing protein [Gordonibacter sp.]|nr:DUF3955 domain-containing protein [Gordonibacter sp.]
MDFGEQIKRIRKDLVLTQEQMADKLGVSRQAVSNWENNRNLPDIEMLIEMSYTFGLSLDQLILGGNEMGNMTDKLIRDGSETRRSKFNMISSVIGGALLLLGAACLVIKSMSVEYVDAEGLLHENFFLIPIGITLMFCGLVSFISIAVRQIATKLKS